MRTSLIQVDTINLIQKVLTFILFTYNKSLQNTVISISFILFTDVSVEYGTQHSLLINIL